MSIPAKPPIYRQMIDALVEICLNGQGQIAPSRVRKGVWHSHATPESLPEENAINLLLQRL